MSMPWHVVSQLACERLSAAARRADRGRGPDAALSSLPLARETESEPNFE